MNTIIVAYNTNFIIGDGKTIPWHIPEDLKLFKSLTMGHPCIMGHNTWNSLPEMYKPLSGRTNLIVSRNFCKGEKRYNSKDHIVYVSTIENALRFSDKEDMFIIGGAQIYDYCIKNNLVNRVLASEIKGHLDVVGDLTFPNLKELGWTSKVIKEYNEFTLMEYTNVSKCV